MSDGFLCASCTGPAGLLKQLDTRELYAHPMAGGVLGEDGVHASSP